MESSTTAGAHGASTPNGTESTTLNSTVTSTTNHNSIFDGCLHAIQKHYKLNRVTKSDAQILREKWLIPGLIPFNRWFCVPAGVIIQFCVGSVYAWSIFNKPIDNLIFGYNAGSAPITFYIAIGLLGLSAAMMGPWLERSGPRSASFLGASLFYLGNLLTALALYTKQIWLVFLGYGLIGGFGIGLCYISPVSALQKWFPDRRGLASGFAVCGFGAGSILLSKVQLPLVEAVGLPLTFVIMGSIYFVVMSISSLVLRTPPPDFVVNGVSTEQKKCADNSPGHITISNSAQNDNPIPSLIQAITSLQFRLMWIMFFSNILFGLIIISRLSNIVTDIFDRTPVEASTIISINAALNVNGRFIFSTLSDYLGRKNTYCVMLTLQIIVIGLFSFITSNQIYWAFLLTMFLLSTCYGGGFGVIPAFLTDLFGSSNVGSCHGIILTAWSAAGVGGGLVFTCIFDSVIATGNYSRKDSYPYYLNVWWIFGVVCIGWISMLFIKPTPQDQKFFMLANKFMC